MGLDVIAYSHLRFVGTDTDGEHVSIFTPDGVTDRLDGKSPGMYERTELAHVWWHAEHGTFAIPASERAAIDERIAALHGGSLARACPGDLAVLADAPPITEEMSFRAGSYSGYNRWREQLCELGTGTEPEEVWEDPEAFAGEPFVELVNYSDAEGAFGPLTSAKLAADFAGHAERAGTWAERIEDPDMRAYFLESYAEWQRAFELAAHGGFVILC